MYKIVDAIIGRMLGRSAKNFVATDKICTRANMITVAGIIVTVFYIVQYTYGILLVLIPVIQSLILSTDVVDGIVADRRNEHSKLGKVLDPFRDRFFMFAAFVNLYVLFGDPVVSSVLVLVLTEAVIWTGGAFVYLCTGNIPSVHGVGKARAMVQGVAIVVISVQTYWLGVYYIPVIPLIWIMSGTSVLALMHYTFLFLRRIFRGGG